MKGKLQDNMTPIQLFFCFALVQCSSAGLRVESPGNSTNRNVELTADLIEYCFPSNITIGLIGDAVVFSEFKNQRNSYLLLDSNAKDDRTEQFHRTTPLHHVDLYVVAKSSYKKLGEIMNKLIGSTWWHPDKLYILTSTRSMHDIREFIYLFAQIGQRDVPNCVFVYDDIENNRPSILTYNMFNDNAPEPWKLFRKITTGYGSTKSFFKQPYKLNREVCATLLFDRMSNLTNYPIRMLAMDDKPYVWLTISTDGNIHFNEIGFDTLLLKCIMDHLKLKPSVTTISSNSTTSEQKLITSMESFIRGRFDFFMNSLYCHYSRDTDQTYPIAWTGITAATQRSEMSSLRKILIFMPPYIIALLVITGIGTVLALFYIFKDWDNSLISVIQLILSQSIPRVPLTTPGRLFIIMVFVLYMITNSVFQGNIVKLLTTPRDEFNVETIDDIEKFGYRVVTNAHVKVILEDHFPKIMRQMELDFHDVHSPNSNEAYIDDEMKIEAHYGRSLHTPKKPFFRICRNYLTRPYWPILPKVNKVLSHIFEAGLVDYWRDHILTILEERWPRIPPPPHHRALKLGELDFAFTILFIGLSCSTIVFLIEVIWAKVKQRRRRN